MTQFFHALDNARLAYRDQGAGVPILCLAGLTRGQNDFDALWRAFDGAANGVRFISMDYRGRGASDFTGAQTYSVEQETADALQLLDHLSLPKAAILGTSRGGRDFGYIARRADWAFVVGHRRFAHFGPLFK